MIYQFIILEIMYNLIPYIQGSFGHGSCRPTSLVQVSYKYITCVFHLYMDKPAGDILWTKAHMI